MPSTSIGKTLIIPPLYLARGSRNPTKRYYLGGAMSLLGDEGGAHHLATAPQPPRLYQAPHLNFYETTYHSISQIYETLLCRGSTYAHSGLSRAVRIRNAPCNPREHTNYGKTLIILRPCHALNLVYSLVAHTKARIFCSGGFWGVLFRWAACRVPNFFGFAKKLGSLALAHRK